MLKRVKVEKAVGLMLGADITKIIPNEYKGPIFKKGHIVEEKDINELKKAGKEYIWVYFEDERHLHQDHASIEIANSIISNNLYVDGPSEGWAYIKSKESGILIVNEKAITKLNMYSEIILTTRETYSLVSKGEIIAKFKITKLEIRKDLYKRILQNVLKTKQLHGYILDILKPQCKKAGVIVTGNEIYSGLVKDAASFKVKEKLANFEVEVIYNTIVPDSKEYIKNAILYSIEAGAEIVILTGGMGPDPDDNTRAGIKAAGGKIIKYGIPVNPATMSIISWIGNTPVLGISAGFINYKNSFLDFILPRLLIGAKVKKSEIAAWGIGGMLDQK
ncbi:molybdopterin-binding protein [Caldisericum exile]|uniref:MoaB/Mog domain-containing protein n=1 Tax=Caldisericum exile (strain DSM 21853 / NBRC 104410 / AZM16c01) TaxID=511051 RepID=A0A7U6GE04_CALEA|nr:molybdopterin-binding protein [Caldisericum exile]BAL80577.1 hypothetical protein CSE_04510 [Caldisericum exile AZM16c01]